MAEAPGGEVLALFAHNDDEYFLVYRSPTHVGRLFYERRYGLEFAWFLERMGSFVDAMAADSTGEQRGGGG